MACANEGDCQANNTVCTSNQCECDTGFAGLDFYLSDAVIAMTCANVGDCQAVLSNTACTSNQCECDRGFSGPDFLSFRCCHRDDMCQRWELSSCTL